MAPYLRPTAPIAADVLLPADPGLAMTIAQRLMVKPRMANHHHGLWGYSGVDADGRELTVQASGIGGPSAAAVLSELAEHGARRVVRLGRCLALSGRAERGAVLVVDGAIGSDGVSRALGVARARPDPALTAAAVAAVGGLPAIVASADLPGAAAPAGRKPPWELDGATAIDLETAAVLAWGKRLELSMAAVLVVAEDGGGPDGDDVDARLAELAPALARTFDDRG